MIVDSEEQRNNLLTVIHRVVPIVAIDASEMSLAQLSECVKLRRAVEEAPIASTEVISDPRSVSTWEKKMSRQRTLVLSGDLEGTHYISAGNISSLTPSVVVAAQITGNPNGDPLLIVGAGMCNQEDPDSLDLKPVPATASTGSPVFRTYTGSAGFEFIGVTCPAGMEGHITISVTTP